MARHPTYLNPLGERYVGRLAAFPGHLDASRRWFAAVWVGCCAEFGARVSEESHPRVRGTGAASLRKGLVPMRCAACFGRLVAVCAVLGASATPSLLADTAPVDLQLLPPSGSVNKFDITVTAFASGTEEHDTDTTTVTGNALSVLTFDLDPMTCEATVTGLEFTGGRIHISDPSFTLDYGWLGKINASGGNISGTLDTPSPPGSILGIIFPADEHTVTLDQGTFHASGTGLVGGLFEPMAINLTTQPITATPEGIGTLTVSSPAIVGRSGTYDVTLVMPVNFQERVLDNDPLFVDVAGTGSVRATAQFTQPLPDPPLPRWTGQMTDRWDNRANWSSVLSPGPASTAVFDAAAPRQAELYGNETVTGIEFRTAGWTVEGGFRLTVGSGGIASDGPGASTVRGAVTMAADSTWTVGAGNTLHLAAELDGGGRALTKAGPGTLGLAGARNLAALNIDGGTARLASGGANVLVADAVSIAPAAALDLTDNALIVDYTGGASPYGALQACVATGCADGSWGGPGIHSSVAAGHTQNLTAVGAIDNSDPQTAIGGLTTFAGRPVTDACVLVRYTWWGDANLDGVVDSNDYDRINTNWLLWTAEGIVPEGGFRWAAGDFNYDGVIDTNDYDRINNAWLLSGSVPVGAGTPAPLPEPASAALVLAGLALAARRAHRLRTR